MPVILAVEPDRKQAARLAAIVRHHVGAELVLADTTERALDALGARIPDMVLVPALLSPQDDASLAAALRVIAAAAHVRTLTIPLLASGSEQEERGGFLSRWRRGRSESPALDGCDPAVFAEQITAYLKEAAAERREAPASFAPIIDRAPADALSAEMRSNEETLDVSETLDFGMTGDVSETANFGTTVDTGETVNFETTANAGETVNFGMTADAGETVNFGMTADAGETVNFEMTADAGETMKFGETVDFVETLEAETPLNARAMLEEETPNEEEALELSDDSDDLDISDELVALSDDDEEEELFAGEPFGTYTLPSVDEIEPEAILLEASASNTSAIFESHAADHSGMFETLAASEPLVDFEAPAAFERPVAWEPPVACEPPVVFEPPAVFEPPVAFEAPVTFEAPVAYKAQVAFEHPAVLELMGPVPMTRWRAWPPLEGVPIEVAGVAAAKPDVPDWSALMASLREDMERRRGGERPAALKQKPRLKAEKPAEDEWGFFDPEQCGFSALLAKLDEITSPTP
jgi:hypothetical protein